MSQIKFSAPEVGPLGQVGVETALDASWVGFKNAADVVESCRADFGLIALSCWSRVVHE